jgi:DNA mismatch repair protein MutL
MGKIVVLDENTSNKIAAGEVIDRPASVIKELVENSIDAGADNISIDIRNGGISYMRVTDNGTGMDEDDVVIAFDRHATSKIRSANDLDSVATLGFRGEALASIAAVSNVQLTTRTPGSPYGMSIEISGENVKDVRQAGCPTGTTFVVKDLFFNTPARYKFLKKDSTEAGYISDIISRIALGNPSISFRLTSNGSDVIHTPGNNDLLSVIFSIYGKETARGVVELKYCDEKVKLSGYAGKPEIARSNRNHQSIFLNGRYIKSKVITSAIDEAYKTLLMKRKHAFVVLNIEINPVMIDVNVHPSKMEVRFSNEQDIFRSVYHAISEALHQKPLIKSFEMGSKNSKLAAKSEIPFRLNDIGIEYNQQSIGFDDHIIKEDMHKATQTQTILPRSSEEKKYLSAPKEAVTQSGAQGDDSTYPLTDAKVVGQAFSTYIILEVNDELVLLDQHAAHERIMFEKLKNSYFSNEPLSQMLLAPVVVEVTSQEAKYLEDEQQIFNKIGFIYDNFGNNSIVLRSVPYGSQSGSVKEIFLEIVDFAMNSHKTDFNVVAEEVLYTVACKAAVKANKKLDEAEIRGVLKELAHVRNPYTCPHGRPTAIKITKHELEKKFKRIL